MAKTTHLIQRYSVSEGTILCVCEWEGKEDVFRKHQLHSPPTDKKPPPNKYAGTEFQTQTIVWPDLMEIAK